MAEDHDGDDDGLDQVAEGYDSSDSELLREFPEKLAGDQSENKEQHEVDQQDCSEGHDDWDDVLVEVGSVLVVDGFHGSFGVEFGCGQGLENGVYIEGEHSCDVQKLEDAQTFNELLKD